MEKILLGISASPRKHGNCELLIKEIFGRLGEGWELRLVRLADRDIKPCRACYQCLFNKMRCPQEDDFLSVLDELAGADAFVAAAPAYLLSANGSLKRFLDRGLQFYAYVDRLWAKPGVGVAVAGIEGREGSTKLGVENFIKMAMGDLRGSAVIYGALPGETLLSAENRETPARLALALTDPEKRLKPEGPVCPLCGGDTFRFLPEGAIRCMLCSGSGNYVWKDGSLHVEIEPGEHPFIMSKEEAILHAEWLRGMKDKFLKRRKELKEVVRNYLGVGRVVGEK